MVFTVLAGTFNMNLQHEFQQISHTFFPRWDRGKLWKCRAYQNLNGSCGECCVQLKTVKIVVGVDNPTLVLIHEICHAIGGSGHEKKWQRRMEKAAAHAQMIGRLELAEQIREEVRQYQNTLITTEEDIYERLDEILASDPTISILQAVDEIRRTFGISTSRKEFYNKYKRFKTEFTERQRWFKSPVEQPAYAPDPQDA
jgi:hypothetical protein